MAIVHLYCANYPDSPKLGNSVRFGDRPERIDDPHWSQIADALLRLDRNEWPYVWLHSEPPIDDETPNNMLCVMGCRGLYAITLHKDGDEIRFFDRTKRVFAESEVTIWESDQGCDVGQMFLCESIDELRKIVHTFHAMCEFPELKTGKRWKVC